LCVPCPGSDGSDNPTTERSDRLPVRRFAVSQSAPRASVCETAKRVRRVATALSSICIAEAARIGSGQSGSCATSA
jgi:hypothetical protein